MGKIYYATDTERETLINDATANGEYLIEDAITVTEGNYLIFSAYPLGYVSAE